MKLDPTIRFAISKRFDPDFYDLFADSSTIVSQKELLVDILSKIKRTNFDSASFLAYVIEQSSDSFHLPENFVRLYELEKIYLRVLFEAYTTQHDLSEEKLFINRNHSLVKFNIESEKKKMSMKGGGGVEKFNEFLRNKYKLFLDSFACIKHTNKIERDQLISQVINTFLVNLLRLSSLRCLNAIVHVKIAKRSHSEIIELKLPPFGIIINETALNLYFLVYFSEETKSYRYVFFRSKSDYDSCLEQIVPEKLAKSRHRSLKSFTKYLDFFDQTIKLVLFLLALYIIASFMKSF